MRSYKHSAAPERGTSQDYRPLQTFRSPGAGNLTRLSPSTNIPLPWSGEPHKTIALYKHSAPLERGSSQDYCPLQTFRSAGAGNLTKLLPYYKHSSSLFTLHSSLFTPNHSSLFRFLLKPLSV